MQVEFMARLREDLTSDSSRTAPERMPQYWLLVDFVSRNESLFPDVRGQVTAKPPTTRIAETVLDERLTTYRALDDRTSIVQIQDFLNEREFLAATISSNGLFGPMTTRSARVFASSAFENWPTGGEYDSFKAEFEQRLRPDLEFTSGRAAPELIKQYWLLQDYVG